MHHFQDTNPEAETNTPVIYQARPFSEVENAFLIEQ